MNTKFTKKTALAAFTLTLMAIAGLALGGGLDNNPRNAGGTLSRNSAGVTLDGAMGNPALIGLDKPPRGGLSLLPFSVTVWSDKLSPPLDLNIINDPSDYITKFMRESFNLKGNLTPEEVSKRLTNELRDGIGVYAGVKTSPVVFATRGFGLSVSTFADVDVRIPGGLLIPFFADTTEGLLAGKKGIDLSDMHVNAISASEIAVKLGYTTAIPFLREYLGLDKGGAGVGVKLLLGHSYLDAKMQDGSAISYSDSTNKYKAGARFDVLSAGTGFNNNFRYDEKYLIDNPINGQGWGLDLGTIFHNENHAVSVDVQDIGMILWNGKAVRRGSISFKPESGFEDGFDLNDLQLGINELFKYDTLAPTNESYIMWLPAALNLGYTYNLRINGGPSALLGYLTTSLGYNQQLILGIGHDSYSPRFSAGATLGLLAGYLPVRYGVTYGGPQKLTSALGLGLGLGAKYFSTDLFYKAVGSPILLPKRGFEAGGGLTFQWGFRYKAKAKSKTKLPKCAAADEFAWIDDTLSEEPTVSVIFEFFPDDDESENEYYEPIEIDMVMSPPPPPTTTTTTPTTTETETDPMPQPTAEETEMLVVSQRAINFVSGSANLTESSYAPLNAIANLLKLYPHIRYEIQGHTDSKGTEMHNLLLSAERAAVVKYYLISRGAPESSLVAVGYGKNIPIADNQNTVGRALNRRVEFVQILSQEHYDWVKRFELEMIPRLTNRVILHKKRITEPNLGE
ncbi:MAG: DUF5723 family protein [Chitinispirillales bacterium]|jgi:outer membrane protein OmpA-like peptidoglycan-associated protein|nr:DUF5723 family protein [Chitinispirillales bacterium]